MKAVFQFSFAVLQVSFVLLFVSSCRTLWVCQGFVAVGGSTTEKRGVHKEWAIQRQQTKNAGCLRSDERILRHPPSSIRLQMSSVSVPVGIREAILSSDLVVHNGDSYSEEEEEAIDRPKVGFLLLNLGGPETSDDVEGFLYNLFADPDIIRLPAILAPLQSLIALGISKRRAPKSKEAYNSIGGGSPILKYSRQQADLIQRAIQKRHGLDVRGYIGMRYWHPFTTEALEEIQKDGITDLVVVPLYPQFSISTSGSSLRVLQEEFAKHDPLRTSTNTNNHTTTQQLRHTVVASWYNRPGYIACTSQLIRNELESFTKDQLASGQGKRHVLFSAHGVPQSYIEAGDPYQKQIEECVAKISAQLPSQEEGVEVHLSYQSRVGPIEWLRPYTDDVIRKLGTEQNVKNLVVVPISFVSEHVETLEEMDIEYKELAEECGIDHWRRVPALNTNALFIEDMADLILDALSEPSQTVTEAIIANHCDSIDLEPLDKRVGILLPNSNAMSAERINGRIAMFGVAFTILLELLNGKSLLRMFGI